MHNRRLSNTGWIKTWLAAGWLFSAGAAGCAGQGLPESDEMRASSPNATAGVNDNGGADAANSGGSAGEGEANGAGNNGLDDLPPSDNPDVDAGFPDESSASGGGATGGFMFPDFSGIDFGADDDAGVPELTDAAPMIAGTLVISELIANPVGSTSHEWIELYNPGTSLFNLVGCRLASDSGEHAINKDLFVAAGTYVVLARDSAALDGVAALYTYRDVSFSSSSDDVALRCGEVVIDSLHYETEVTERAQSTQLSLDKMDAIANDAASSWCLGTTPYGISENQGTPGAANRSCP